MKLAREGVEQARANLRLQEADAKPDPDAFLGYKHTFGFNTLYAALQISLPVREKDLLRHSTQGFFQMTQI